MKISLSQDAVTQRQNNVTWTNENLHRPVKVVKSTPYVLNVLNVGGSPPFLNSSVCFFGDLEHTLPTFIMHSLCWT